MSAFNGSGQFTISGTGLPYVPNTTISSTVANTLNSNLATGLSTTICRDGQSTVTANIPWAGFKLTGLGAGTAATDAVNLGQVQNSTYAYVAAGGTADAITAAFTPATTSLTDGALLRVKAGAANATTTPTFAPDGLTAHTITKFGGQALIVGDIFGAGHELLLQYSTTGTRWELLNPVYNYTEGTWTPTFAGDVTPGTFVYGTQIGRWTKNGRNVWLECTLSTTGRSGSPAGNMTVAGLPFACETISGALTPLACIADHVTFDAGFTAMSAVVASGESIVRFFEVGSNMGAGQNGFGNFATSSAVYFSGTYRAAS